MQMILFHLPAISGSIGTHLVLALPSYSTYYIHLQQKPCGGRRPDCTGLRPSHISSLDQTASADGSKTS